VRLSVRDIEGKEVRKIEVDDAVFAIEPNLAVLHQAFVAQRANQRLGTASTRTRSEVVGSTRKIRMQKYTGRARQGSIRAPHHRGGGLAFGPKPRDFSQRLPKKMKRLAIRSALSSKMADEHIKIIDELTFEKPKTQELGRILGNLGVVRSALIVTGQPDRKVFLSARNLPDRKALPASYLNVVDMLTHRDIVMTEAAVRRAEALWGAAATAPPEPDPTLKERPSRRRRVAAEAPEATAVAEVAVAAPSTAEPERPVRRRRQAVEPTSDPPAEASPKAAPAARRKRTTAVESEQPPKPASRARTRRPGGTGSG